MISNLEELQDQRCFLGNKGQLGYEGIGVGGGVVGGTVIWRIDGADTPWLSPLVAFSGSQWLAVCRRPPPFAEGGPIASEMLVVLSQIRPRQEQGISAIYPADKTGILVTAPHKVEYIYPWSYSSTAPAFFDAGGQAMQHGRPALCWGSIGREFSWEFGKSLPKITSVVHIHQMQQQI